MRGQPCLVPVALWQNCCLPAPLFSPTPHTASQKNCFLRFSTAGSFFVQLRMFVIQVCVTSLALKGKSTACAKHSVLLQLPLAKKGRREPHCGHTGPWVSLPCLVGAPGVSLLGNVGLSLLLSDQEADTVVGNFFFFFWSRNPLRTSGRKGKICESHTSIWSHSIYYFLKSKMEKNSVCTFLIFSKTFTLFQTQTHEHHHLFSE